MSASCNLAGLFPPKKTQIWNEDINWQPIPIHTIPHPMDTIIHVNKRCEPYEYYYEQLMRSKEFLLIREKYSWLFEYLSAHSGQRIDSVMSVRHLYDTFKVHKIHDKM